MGVAETALRAEEVLADPTAELPCEKVRVDAAAC